mmetsp:Transcript_11518/g.43209  ORF Transcript_11518/g.43209 Transcript_11518/m.43209 type:complete len:230 (-) Transcript_11518:186-875(-)|eukprot:CAMPEP_0117450390 /NCGR_PEP_ID=MMETSP0759-20121206/8443_1 /TAXON_ID=63605 /ORGANISM="Percolomonas cosmopolitus, Strain WS" /LENGTH=229 /DNA_ID=CAMNT_0005242909 /DNA_START=98 /DNA_END=787 /DNA_ORIENTATION=+
MSYSSNSIRSPSTDMDGKRRRNPEENQSGAKPSILQRVHFNNCLEQTQRILQTESPVFHLLESIREAGCQPPRIACVDCGKDKNRIMSGFDSDKNRLFLCFDSSPVSTGNQNLRYEVYRMNIMHELVHAYDQCRANVDFSNLHHHACSEIRASALSSECNFKYERKTGNTNVLNFAGHYRDCIKRRAATSVRENPNFNENHMDAMEIIEEKFDTCYNDIQPFLGRPYRI